VKRIGSVIKLAPGAEAEYRRLHHDVWPAVLKRLAASGITNYTIFLHGELLFSYMEYVGDDLDRDMAAIAADPETQRWWELTVPLQHPVPSAAEGQWWASMEEVFHMDDPELPASAEGGASPSQ
jgi:L-rhamnose mutarotase